MSFDMEKMPLSPPRRRWNIRSILAFALSIVIFHRVYLLLFAAAPAHLAHPHVTTTPQDRGYGEMYRMSFKALAQALQAGRPRTASVGPFDALPGISVESIDQPTSIDILKTSSADIKVLAAAHEAFMGHLNDGPGLNVIYQRSTSGIVTTASADELPAVLVALRLLRRTGSTLPVEIFLLTHDDYDAKVCREILPKLDAHCAVLEEYTDVADLPRLPQSRRERKLSPQEPLSKLLAIYFSKFEDVLLLDPATLVYNNPDIMLKEEPFLSTGMLLWPDFWASTVSPKLFAIQNVPEQKPNRRDNIRTVDMGQLIMSKSQHGATLLLAIYYTYFGENLYDALLQQSSAGEHGSQAIKSAARYLERPYYMMKRYVEAVGYPDMDQPDSGFHGVAMLQAFAADDFHRIDKDAQRPVFVRANNPVLHPAFVMDRGVTVFSSRPGRDAGKPHDDTQEKAAAQAEAAAAALADKRIKVPGRLSKGLLADLEDEVGVDFGQTVPKQPPTSKDRGEHHRMWEWFGGRYKSNGWRDPDPERAIWEEISQVACRDQAFFRVWPASTARARQLNCDRINYHRGELGWGEIFQL